MNSGIYQIKNTTNGKCYIGSAVNIQQRWATHLSTLHHKCHYNFHLQRAFDKYNEEAFLFEVLEETEPEMLIEREQYYLDTFKPEYNICPTAGSQLGIQRIEKIKQKISAANRGKQAGERHPMYGKHHTEETKCKMSRALKGRLHTEETKCKMSKALKGRLHNEETKRKISEALKAYWRRKREKEQES